MYLAIIVLNHWMDAQIESLFPPLIENVAMGTLMLTIDYNT